MFLSCVKLCKRSYFRVIRKLIGKREQFENCRNLHSFFSFIFIALLTSVSNIMGLIG